MKLKLFLLLIITTGYLLPQSVDDYFYKIDIKLKKDKKYLNLHYIDLPLNPQKLPEELRSIPRTNDREAFQFLFKDNVTYKIVFLKDAVGIDSLILLYIDQVTDLSAAVEGFFVGTGGPSFDTVRVVNFQDMYTLKQNHRQIYGTLFKIVNDWLKQSGDEPPPSMLGIQPDTEIKTSLGISSRDNTDYVNYMRANSIHYYPPITTEKKGGRRGQQEEVPSTFKIDATLTGFSFSHDIMQFGVGSGSIEFGFGERVLNLLPFQPMTINGGFRTMIMLSDKKSDKNNALMLDARFLGRMRLNTFNLVPYVIADKPKLHVGQAAGIELFVTRPFTLPFMNIYFSTGGQGYSSPNVKFDETPTTKVAYFSFTQAEATFSFYWNTSDKMNSRFRMDVGGAYYDVWKGIYQGTRNTTKNKTLLQGKFFPVIAIHFNFVPENVDLLGVKVRFFDSQFMLNAWLKLVEFEGGHVIRFDGTFVSAPMLRKSRAWETDGGAVMQIRYRYGF
jgi:hypothetical protein